jgi:hypothetical protein
MPPAAPRPHALVSLLPRAGAAAGATLSLALLLTAASSPAPLPVVSIALLGVAALTAWRLEPALIAFALLVPIARFAGRPWAPAAAWPEMLAVAVIAGWFCRRAAATARRLSVVDAPIAVTAMVVIASLVVVTTLAQWRLTGALLSPAWWNTYRQGYFLLESSGEAVDTAMRLLETLVLFYIAASVAERSPIAARWLAASIAAGAAVAAAINVWAMWHAAAAPAFSLSAFARELLTARVSAHYADPNAAGSYFVMVLPVAIGLALEPRTRWWWTAAALTIAAGLWISASRSAMMAGLVAMVLPIAARAGVWRTPAVRRRIVIAAVLALAVAAAATAYLLPHRATQRSANDALRVRYELSRTAVRMLATAPLFGVGVGNFFNLSGQFVSAELLALFPPAARENAHNYYLQLLAEIGIAGVAAYGWLAWVAGRRAARLFGAPASPPPWQWGIAVGIAAFALTCLAGHPLLIDEPAFTFALLAGTVVGCGSVVRSERSIADDDRLAGERHGPGRLGAMLVVLLLATIPLRWYSGRAAMDLSDVAFGLTGWYPGRDGVAYRLAGRTSRIYLPAGYKAITIPLRATEPHGEVELVIRVDGAVIERKRIGTGAWQVIRLPLPAPSSSARFRALDLEVVTTALTPRVLFIGRITSY